MIRLENVTCGYGAGEVLKNISLDLPDGDFVAILGANGAGKTTLVKLLNGLNRPASGTVYLDGEDMKPMRTSRLASRIGFLFQNPDRQIFCDDLRGELAFGLERAGLPAEEIEKRVQETAEDFDLDLSINPLTASRGQRQRIALAALVALRPSVIVLDEPTTGLDWSECMRIMERVRRLNQEEGTTVVMVCHDMELVLDFAKRVVVLSEGQVLFDGEAKEALANEELLRRASLLPPQILALTNRLGGEFRGIDSEMALADALEGRCGKCVKS